MASVWRWIVRILSRLDCRRRGTYRIPKTGLRMDWIEDEYFIGHINCPSTSHRAESEEEFKSSDIEEFKAMDIGDTVSLQSSEDIEVIISPTECQNMRDKNSEQFEKHTQEISLKDLSKLEVNFPQTDTAKQVDSDSLDDTDSEKEGNEEVTLNDGDMLISHDLPKFETDTEQEKMEQKALEDFEQEASEGFHQLCSDDTQAEEDTHEMNSLIPYDLPNLESDSDSEQETLDEREILIPEEVHQRENDSGCSRTEQDSLDDQVIIISNNLPELSKDSEHADEEALDVIDIFMEDSVPPQFVYHDMELEEPLDGTLRKKTVKPDVLIIVQNQEYRGHQRILRANSKFFSERLAQKQCVIQIESECVSAEAFEAIMTFMYTGEMAIPCQLISDVFKAASYLGIAAVTEKCREMIDIASMDLQKIVRLYITAFNLNLDNSRERALELMATLFEEIVMQRDYLEMTKDQLIDLITKDAIGARSETVVFLSVLKWLNQDFLQREVHATDVLKCVRFSSMTREEILTSFHPPLLPGLLQMDEIRQRMLEALCYIAASEHGIEERFKDMASETPRQLLLKGRSINLWDTSVFDPDYPRECAAIRIQSAFRGYLARRRLLESSQEDLRTRYSEWRSNQLDEEDEDYQEYVVLEQEGNSITGVIKCSNKNYKKLLKMLHLKNV